MPPKKKAPKAAKKKDVGPKAPIGRPRKNLGTRVSDLPLVSTLKPTTRRVNIDSLAINRARLAYKRDYGKTLDERQSRALIDAMSTTKRGPIGTAVVGTFKRESDAKTTPGYTEHEGFINYYKQALKAAKKNPGNVVTVKKKKDGSLKFEIPGIPEATPGTLSATSVPKSSSKEIAIQTQMYTVKEQLQAKIAGLREAIDSGTLDDGATALALAKIEEHKANIVKIQEALVDMPAPKLSPMDDASTLALERARQRDVVTSLDSTDTQKKAAQAQVKRLDKKIEALQRSTETQEEIPVSDADIAAVLGEPEEERPLVRPTRRIRRDDPGPSAPATATATAGPSRKSAPATATAALKAALADPAVSAIVEQVQENAPAIVEQVKENTPVKRAPSARAKANMLKLMKAAKIKKDRKTAADLRAKAAAEAKALENAPGRTREQIAADAADQFDKDVREREAIAQSARDIGDRILTQAAEEQGRQMRRIVAPTIQSFVRGYQTRKRLKKEADAQNYTERLKNMRAKRDQDIDLQNLANLAEQGDQSASIPSQERKARRQAMLEQAVQEEAASRGLSETEAARVMERERQEQELRDQERSVQRSRSAPTIQSLVRGRQTRKQLKKDADSRNYNELLKNMRANRDQDNYLDEEFEAEDVDEEDYEELARRDDAASKIQAAMRSKLTQSAFQKAIDQQEKEDAAIRVIQRAVRDKVEGVAKQKRILSKVPYIDTRAPPPARPPSAPGMTQPSIRYGMDDEDLIEDIDLSGQFGAEDDAARKIQAALRRFGDRSRFAKAREVEAEYARENDIVVPGSDIRPNTRTIPDTDRMARALQESGYTQMKRSYESIPEKPDGSLIGFPREVPRAYDTARLPIKFQRAGEDYIPVDAVFERERLPAFRDLADLNPRRSPLLDEQALREQRDRLKRVVKQEDVAPVVQNLIKDVISDALFARRLRVGPDAPVDDNDADWETSPNPYSGRGLVGGRRSFAGGVQKIKKEIALEKDLIV